MQLQHVWCSANKMEGNHFEKKTEMKCEVCMLFRPLQCFCHMIIVLCKLHRSNALVYTYESRIHWSMCVCIHYYCFSFNGRYKIYNQIAIDTSNEMHLHTRIIFIIYRRNVTPKKKIKKFHSNDSTAGWMFCLIHKSMDGILQIPCH